MKLPIDVQAIIDFDNLLYIRGKLGIKKALVTGVKIHNGEILVNDQTTKRVIKKMIQGVTVGFKEKLKIIGVGYKAQLNKDKNQLELMLGFKDPIILPIEDGIEIQIKTNGTVIEAKSTSQEKLSQFLSKIVLKRSAIKDVYKGKGVM